MYGMKFRNGSHTKYKIEYHFVWVTKYRYQVLTGDVGLRVCEYFEIEKLRGVVSKEHIHLLVFASSSISTSEIVRRLKGRSSTKVLQEFSH